MGGGGRYVRAPARVQDPAPGLLAKNALVQGYPAIRGIGRDASFCRPRLPADAGGLASKLPALGFEPSLVLRLHGGMEPSGDVPAERTTEGASLTDAFGRQPHLNPSGL
jgi:hypothetical protein